MKKLWHRKTTPMVWKLKSRYFYAIDSGKIYNIRRMKYMFSVWDDREPKILYFRLKGWVRFVWETENCAKIRMMSILSSLLAGAPILTRLAVIPAWTSNYIHHDYKVWGEITYPFPNFNGCTIEVWEWINNFIPHSTGHVITFPCWDLS